MKLGMPTESLDLLAIACTEISELNPFAHRTTVQGMLNHQEKESSDQLLDKSFQQCIKELDAAGYKPDEIAINKTHILSSSSPRLPMARFAKS